MLKKKKKNIGSSCPIHSHSCKTDEVCGLWVSDPTVYHLEDAKCSVVGSTESGEEAGWGSPGLGPLGDLGFPTYSCASV